MFLILFDAFGTDTFDDLYEQYEQDDSIKKKSVGAQKLILDLLEGESRDRSYLHYEY